jgi:hypothetical protein
MYTTVRVINNMSIRVKNGLARFGFSRLSFFHQGKSLEVLSIAEEYQRRKALRKSEENHCCLCLLLCMAVALNMAVLLLATCLALCVRASMITLEALPMP